MSKKKKTKDPCVDVCKIDKETGFCLGCMRTKSEIKGWKKFSKHERRDILEVLKQRAA